MIDERLSHCVCSSMVKAGHAAAFLGPVVCCDVVRRTPASVVSGHIFLEFSVFQNYIDVLRQYDDVDT